MMKNLRVLPVLKQNSEVSQTQNQSRNVAEKLPEILFITSFPPRECGIATYSQDLISSLKNKFNDSFEIKICALETNNEKHKYNDKIRYTLNTDCADEFILLAEKINENEEIKLVLIQHEFGFFVKNETAFLQFLYILTKKVVIVFHTVLPNPNELLRAKVKQITAIAEGIIVMTNSSATILVRDYEVSDDKISVIPHGTHLVGHADKILLKEKYELNGKKVLSTFGLLSSGKNIETTLEALPEIIKIHSDILFLIIGKTHPSVVKQEGESYRLMLEAKVEELHLQQNVKFVNYFLPLQDLLEYLQLTDIYLFTSKDPNQAVSGTFSYAISCGCPIISTRIPHACEVLGNDAGIIIDFQNPRQLAHSVIHLLNDEELMSNISLNGLHRMASTAWENSSIAHSKLFEKIADESISLHFTMPEINLAHIKKMTTEFGIIQFSKLNHPDIESGYTLDDNARALIAMCQHFDLTKSDSDVSYITVYLNFIKHCLQPPGNFLNYVDEQKCFTTQNDTTNLEDSNGRAIWALGFLISLGDKLPEKLVAEAESILRTALTNSHEIHSTRAMSFMIKGLYYCNTQNKSDKNVLSIRVFANRLVQMYRHESDKNWEWFESYLTYANSVIPEAMLCAWLATGEPVYWEIAKSSFDFLLSKIFKGNHIKVISNKNWLHKDKEHLPVANGGEQPIDVAYTILVLNKFYEVFGDKSYCQKIEISMNWFLGANHLNQIIYNPCTGGCYDGLEENYVNLNQGAESTVSYLMARLTCAKQIMNKKTFHVPTHKQNLYSMGKISVLNV